MHSSKALRPFLITLVVALVLVLTFYILTLFIGKRDPRPAIELTGKDVEGSTIFLSDCRGRSGVALVYFELEHRHSQEVVQRIIPKAKELGVEVIAVCQTDLSAKECLARMKELKMPTPEHLLLDPKGELSAVYNVSTAPCTYFIDKNGMILDAYLGTISEPSAEKELKAIA